MTADRALLIELDRVSKVYGTGDAATHALRGVDLRVRSDELVALIGPSGSGKSTLLNILGLLDRPSDGRVVVDGRDVDAMSEADRTRYRGHRIGFVFQFHHLLPGFTALENVELPLVIEKGSRRAMMADRARELLARVGLEDKLNSRINDLSGGQQQRVAIARALSLRPPLILADEPTGNLDTESSDQVFALLREIREQDGTAFLIVTHDSRIADRCERVIELVDGRIDRDERR